MSIPRVLVLPFLPLGTIGLLALPFAELVYAETVQAALAQGQGDTLSLKKPGRETHSFKKLKSSLLKSASSTKSLKASASLSFKDLDQPFPKR